MAAKLVSSFGMSFADAWRVTMREYVALLNDQVTSGRARVKRRLPGPEDMAEFISEMRRKGVEL